MIDPGLTERLKQIERDRNKRIDQYAFAVLIAALAVALLICLIVWSVLAAPPPDADLTLHAWFERQHSVRGGWCCNLADGHVVADEDWRAGDDRYRVRIDGTWYDIDPETLRAATDDPNPTGHAIVWYVTGSDHVVRIYCFAPGTLL